MIISHLEEVEDTKGNSGDSGYLYITNLRVIWTSASQFRVNLSKRGREGERERERERGREREREREEIKSIDLQVLG